MKSKNNNKLKKNKIKIKPNDFLNKEGNHKIEEKNIINNIKNDIKQYESKFSKNFKFKSQKNELKKNNVFHNKKYSFLKKKRFLKSNDNLDYLKQFDRININKENEKILNKNSFKNKVESLPLKSLEFSSYPKTINSEKDIINIKIKNNKILDNNNENNEEKNDFHFINYQAIFEQEFLK